jgi:hypothetical protein
VPNVVYDLLLYSKERGPIAISAKTSLRERYKQADLEGRALKAVHKRALSYLITLDDKEAERVSGKIARGEVLGLDKVITATVSEEMDGLVEDLKAFEYVEPEPVRPVRGTVVPSLTPGAMDR